MVLSIKQLKVKNIMLKLILTDIQHIKKLTFELDLSKNKITCLVGKNSVGKTTLIRSIANLKSSDTFVRTASPKIFSNSSKITYEIDDDKYDFKYARFYLQVQLFKFSLKDFIWGFKS